MLFSSDERTESEIDSLIQQMSFEEKAAMLIGDGMWFFEGCERLGVPKAGVTDCGHGITNTGSKDCCATCLPTAIGQAATWNASLLEEIGGILGRESAARGNSLVLGPMVNLHRCPLNGRSFECFSEDPHLTGKLGAAVVKGIQSTGVAACIKGITGNNIQANQAISSSDIDERTLREIYLPNFRIPVTEAAPAAVMTCYNAINGEPSSECGHVLQEILKDQWGFEGLVVSDWRGTHSTKCISSGLDIEMPGPGKFMLAEQVADALESGEITEDYLHDKLRRILRCLLKLRTVKLNNLADLDSEQNRQIALDAARESITLVKNEDNILPLKQEKLKKIAVIGPNAACARLGGGGSASVTPFFSISPLEGLQQLLDGRVKIEYVEANTFFGDYPTIPGEFLQTCEGSSGIDCHFFNNENLEGSPDATSTDTRLDYSWGWASPCPKIGRNGWSARFTAKLVAPVSGKYRLGACARDSIFSLYIDGELALDCWDKPDGDSINEQGMAVHQSDPNETVEIELEAGKPVELRLDYLKLANKAALRLQWQRPDQPDETEVALQVAKDADAVIMCMGLCNQHEGGGNDRESTELPDSQIELIKRISAVNPKVIVTLNSGGVIAASRWQSYAKAIIYAWYPGQSGGQALAEILLGKVNPSGKLPDTVAVCDEDSSWFGHIGAPDNRIKYSEGVFMGYRHFDTAGKEVSYPFGYGRSYTNFEYSNIELSDNTISAGKTITASVTVTNTGSIAGKEIVQLYISDCESSVPRPVRELKAFNKISLNAGQSQTVSFEIKPEDLAFFDEKVGDWQIEAGRFIAQIGPHSREGLEASFSYSN